MNPTEAKSFDFKQLKLALLSDKVTGLANQTSLYEDLTCAGREVKLSLVLISIDGFERIAKMVDKEAANEVLKNITDILKQYLPFGSHLYRSDLEEFAIALEGYKEHEVEHFTQEIHKTLHGLPLEIEGKEFSLSISMGIIVNHPADGVLSKAKSALQELKDKETGGGISFYNDTSGFNQHRMQHAKMVLEVRRALNEERVFPYFQPIVDIKTLKTIRYECLARMKSKTDKILLPLDFMLYMKMGGLMKNLTRTMVLQCFKHFKNSNHSFSINVTLEDLLDESFLRFLREQARDNHIAPSQVLLEVEEDLVFCKKNYAFGRVISELHESGFKFAIDNFGRLENCMEQLEHVACNVIKIDGKFIRDIDTSSKKEEMVQNIVHVTKELGIHVIAEHVSRNEEKKVLERLGVPYVQGYLFGHPSQVTK